MDPLTPAMEPFRFNTSLVLQESLGLRAEKLTTLVKLLRTVPAASVYHHTHHFLLQYHYLSPQPPNDFAYWVGEVLGERPLAEWLAGVDTMAYSSLEDLRGALAGTIERYLEQSALAHLRFAAPGQEFFFVKAVHVVLPTSYAASTLAEFAEALQKVGIRSLYYHMFEARLRLGRPTNDFSRWMGEHLGLPQLAAEIAAFDPYGQSLEVLRTRLLMRVQAALARQTPASEREPSHAGP